MQFETKIAHFMGHIDSVYTLKNGPNGGSFFSSGGDGMVVLWRLENPAEGKPIVKVPGSVYAMHFNNERREILVASNRDGLHLVDLDSKLETWNYSTPDHQWFRMIEVEGKIWIAGSGGRIIEFDPNKRTVKEIAIGRFDIRALDFQEDKRQVILGNSNNEIIVFDLETQSQKIISNAHNSSVFGLKFFPFEAKFVSVGRDAKLKLWEETEAGNWVSMKEVAAHLFGIHDVVIHPTKPLLATGSTDKNIKIWDAETLKLLRVLDKTRHAGHGHSINQLLWLENSEVLLSCSDDRTISAWNIFA